MHPYIKAAKDIYTEDELQMLYDVELEMIWFSIDLISECEEIEEVEI